MEQHPLAPFLPKQAKVLLLGSFPPSKNRWSIDFYYPNWINDMWRIFGLVFFSDKEYFTIPSEKKFDKDKIVSFLTHQGIAVSDTAQSVTRTQGNASDKYLQVDQAMDVASLLSQLPQCTAVITTGEKASLTLGRQVGVEPPLIGEGVPFSLEGRNYTFYRLPSSSRAYPKPIEEKAALYKRVFKTIFGDED
ncbi:MAG: uracil-DNA glycosylase family protein [Paludibacteraceae bacterium]|nr:uracil-DNA glycosylase family protein [Paludibacteraceae bacterium]